MNTETLDLPHGYKAEIATDDTPANPFTDWDCEMPIAVCNLDRHHSRLENYEGDTLSLETLLDLLPRDTWETRTGKREIINALPVPPSTIAEMMREWRECFEDAVTRYVREELTPAQWQGWSAWQEYFDAMESVAALAGIPCHLTQSNGYCQGDCALVFAAALPAWVKAVGAPPETLADQCRATCDLWSAWAWGDVYGIRAIIAPDGEELDDGSVWGFYGTDHEKSGLMDCALETVNAHRKYLARETAAAFDAACRDIDTLPLHLAISA